MECRLFGGGVAKYVWFEKNGTVGYSLLGGEETGQST